jgi:hypothetical protein
MYKEMNICGLNFFRVYVDYEHMKEDEAAKDCLYWGNDDCAGVLIR